MSVTALDTIDRLLLERGNSHAETAAILAEDRPSLSYRALAGQLLLVGQSFRRFGVNRSDSVAVVLPNGPEMAVAFLTISACARFAPLNPAYEARDFEFALDDLRARAVVVPAGQDSRVRAVAHARNIPLLELAVRPGSPAGMFDLKGGEIRAVPGTDSDYARPDDVALVLQTSGTTSRPKLVPLTHRNLCNSARNIAGTLKLTPEDRALSTLPMFHTHGLVGMVLTSIMAGAGVICTPGFDATRFFEWLTVLRPTWYSAVPTLHQAVVSGAARRGDSTVCSKLRFVRSTSSTLPGSVMQELESIFGVPVVESYGMTEASQIASNPLPPDERKPGSVGRATGQEVAIMDDQGNFLPVGETGEIVIRGPNVTRAYENNPAATSVAFVNGWFHTGDLGRLDADCYLFINGRLKEIINRGGEKISPGEIDDALLAHPGVRQAVAFPLPHPTLGEDVAAAVVAKDGMTLDEAELRSAVARCLPPFKVPSRIVVMKEIPKGATGKIQRIGLAKRLAQELSAEFTAPGTELESMIAVAIEQALGRSPVGRHENFFLLGGDSIAATQVLVRLREFLGFEIPPVTFFNHPTVAHLATEVARLQGVKIEALAAGLADVPPEEAKRILGGIETTCS